MCAVNVSVEAVIASRDRRRSGVSQVGDAWRPWDCISSPLGRVRHADPGFFDLFPYNVFPPGTPGDPSVAPKKRRGPRRISPPLFSRGADTRTHNKNSRGSIGCGHFFAGAGPRIGIRHRHPRAAAQSSSSAGVGLRPAFAFSAAIVSTNVSGKARLTRPLRF